jgi:predicted dehydrogenase
MTLGFGIVGCGGAAVDIARGIDAQGGATIVAAHDRLRRNAEDIAIPRGAMVHGDLSDLLADPAVDVVYVGLPHDLLAPTATRALETGHHVLVEKPMALTVEDIRSMGRLAAANKRALGVVFELREVAAVRAARDVVGGGGIGDVRQVRMQVVIDKPESYWRSGPTGRVVDEWRARVERAGGGVVLMNAIHHLDLVRWITGSAFVRAVAEVADPHPSTTVEDVAAAALRLDGGAIASLTVSASSPGALRQELIEIDGTAGRLDLPDPYSADPLRAYFRRPWNSLAADRWHAIEPPPVDPYAAFLTGFIQAIETGSPVPAGPSDAAAALATVLAIYESARAGRAVDIDGFEPKDRSGRLRI